MVNFEEIKDYINNLSIEELQDILYTINTSYKKIIYSMSDYLLISYKIELRLDDKYFFNILYYIRLWNKIYKNYIIGDDIYDNYIDMNNYLINRLLHNKDLCNEWLPNIPLTYKFNKITTDIINLINNINVQLFNYKTKGYDKFYRYAKNLTK